MFLTFVNIIGEKTKSHCSSDLHFLMPRAQNLLKDLLIILLSKGQIARPVPKWMVLQGKVRSTFRYLRWLSGRVLVAFPGLTHGACVRVGVLSVGRVKVWGVSGTSRGRGGVAQRMA